MLAVALCGDARTPAGGDECHQCDTDADQEEDRVFHQELQAEHQAEYDDSQLPGHGDELCGCGWGSHGYTNAFRLPSLANHSRSQRSFHCSSVSPSRAAWV
jgi:hypothetical protein